MTAESQADRLTLVARAGRGVRTEARVVEWSPGPPTHLRPRFRPGARSLARLDLSPAHIARPLRSAHTRARPPCLAPTRDSLDCAACPPLVDASHTLVQPHGRRFLGTKACTSPTPLARTAPLSYLTACRSSVLSRRMRPKRAGDSRLGTAALGRRSRTRELSSTHARRLLALPSGPLACAPSTQAAIVSSRLPPSKSTGTERVHPHHSPSTCVPPLAIVASSLRPRCRRRNLRRHTKHPAPQGRKKTMLGQWQHERE